MVTADASLEGEHVAIGASEMSKVKILASLGRPELVVDVPGGGGGVLKLLFTDPITTTDYSITFPSQSGTLLLDSVSYTPSKLSVHPCVAVAIQG